MSSVNEVTAEMMIEKLKLKSDRALSQQQIACSGSHCSVPVHGNNLMVYDHLNRQKEPLLLTGHHRVVSAMTFGHRDNPLFLCSASTGYIIVWDIELCKQRVQEGKVASGIVIGTLLGEVVHLSFCYADERVAVCSGATINILSSKRQQVLVTLPGQLGSLTSAEFCPWDADILVSTSENRMFRVWDLKTEDVLYQSFVLSAFPLSTALFLEDRHLIIGSVDGQMWCFSLNDCYQCHLVKTMDLQMMGKRHQRTVNQQAGINQTESDEVEVSKPVLRMASWSQIPDLSADKRSWFCIGSCDGLYVVDVATSELQTVLYFKDHPDLSVSRAGSWVISLRDNKMFFLVSSLFEPIVALLEFHVCDHLRRMRTSAEGLSVIPSSPPLLQSPLNAELKKKESNLLKKKGGIKEQPLVFNSKVKSSGYSSAPRKVMFSAHTNVKKNPRTKNPKKNIDLIHKDYPADSAAPTVLCVDRRITDKKVSCLQYSGDGKHILCGLGDCSVSLYKSCLAGKSSVYLGHDKPVSSVNWSLNRQWWLSASDDLSLRVWTHCSSEPAIVMGYNTFSKPIRGAQFYYLDKFILLSTGPSLQLYLYHVDDTHDDIKRYQQRSIIKQRSCFKTTSATEITTFSAINDFFSYIVLVCGANRSVQMFDMNRGQVACEIPDAHTRAIHCIAQNKGSAFSFQAPDSSNIFLTSAVTDGVKIWDLRTLRCVRRYENHLIRSHPCSADISPCGRLIATGSEDNCAYVYDIRSSSFLHKLQKHSDTVLSVAFNPATPELLTGTLDGKLKLYRPSTGSHLSNDIITKQLENNLYN